MSILKAKIHLIKKKRENKLEFPVERKSEFILEKIEPKNIPRLSPGRVSQNNYSFHSDFISDPADIKSQSKSLVHSPKSQSSNNIMKNYCRGIVNFARSPMALPYLLPLLKTHKLELGTFKDFIKLKKTKINCIKKLREILLISPNDKDEIIAIKVIFREITIIFLKFFAPNWIYSSQISDKYSHLKYRFKILRRVRNPLYFTYLQGYDLKTC